MVDRGAVRRRVGLLPGRPLPGVPPARRPGRRRCGVLRRLAAVHLGGGPAVAPDHQRRRRAAAAGGDLRAAPARLVERRRPAARDAVLQRHHLPGAADRARLALLRPGRVAARRARVGVLPRLRLPRLRRGHREPPWPPAADDGVGDRVREPARLRRLRDLRGRGLRRPHDRQRDQRLLGEHLHRPRGPVLPDRRPPPAPGADPGAPGTLRPPTPGSGPWCSRPPSPPGPRCRPGG